ncbi:ubiquitin carboxyl-terminal hydrolase Usp2 isoform X1 [Drosophila tropicalis]|uniref:ubiquitin carboxyl-terminal hydrolase Usp2 isoform X1 n=1 Tax=Drosophila tropicalis TaxID=46794 RepID=UPI0035ABD04A
MMLDIKKSKGFHKIPAAATGKLQKGSETSSAPGATATSTTTATTTQSSIRGGGKITKTQLKASTTANKISPGVGAGASTAGVLGVGISKRTNNNHNTNTTTTTTTTTTNSISNPVRTANQRYFLISSFKDPTFLKAECELAHSQVQQQQQHRVLVGNTINKTVKLSKRFKSTTNTNEDTKNNNYNNLNDMRRNHTITPMINGNQGSRATATTTTTTTTTTNSSRNGIGTGTVLKYKTPVTTTAATGAAAAATKGTTTQQQQLTVTGRNTSSNNSSGIKLNKLNNNQMMNGVGGGANHHHHHQHHHHHHNQTQNNNNMMQRQQHDDISYIDSDEATPPQTTTTTTTNNTAAATPTAAADRERGSGISGNIKTNICYFKPITPPATLTKSLAAAAAASTGGGSLSSSAAAAAGVISNSSTTTRSTPRPKSTIITSNTNFAASYEKFQGYRQTTTTTTSNDSSNNSNTNSNNARRYGIDSLSIKASIEKFNNLTITGSNNTTTSSTTSSGGLRNPGSSTNLLQQRYGNDFDHIRASAGYSSSLTRAAYRTTTTATTTTTSTQQQPVRRGFTTSESGVGAGTGTGTAAGTTLSKIGRNNSAAAAAASSSSNGHYANIILPTKCNMINNDTNLTKVNDSTTAAATITTTSSSTSSSTTTTTHASASSYTNTNVSSSTNNTASESARNITSSSSSTRNILPPVSPTSSRYWDRDRDSTATTNGRLSSSSGNSTSLSSKYSSNNDDGIKSSSARDEKSEGLCGLRNIGNTCFMNSVIQCLSHTTELTRFLRTHHGSRSSSATKDQQILQEFAKLIQEMWTTNVHTVTPMELKRAFSTKHRMYSDFNQQDAQEFLRFFLDSLHSALNTGVKGGEALNIDDNLSDNKKADLTWDWYTRHENSLVRDLFVGQLKSTLKCTTCGNTSVTFDPFWDLSVPLPPSSSRCKLDACLDLFIREEVLDGDEMPTCSKCKTRRKCKKSFTIQRFPKYLVIHLKRFSETRWSKLLNVVEFPTSDRELNMGSYGSNSNSSVHYSLYAISNHMGSTAGGHYVALCKHPDTRKWHEFNDNIVSDTLSENFLVSASAYILFYERA